MKKTISQLLLKITAWFDPWLFAIFPQANVYARYKGDYSLIGGDLMYLAERVEGFDGVGSHRTSTASGLHAQQVGYWGDSIKWG